ncbi:MAG: tail fiber domain-containing protein [Methylobacterium mesophilicum]|nr:tail fiber domain-containing protein [Methylobacterium mesophilicum]
MTVPREPTPRAEGVDRRRIVAAVGGALLVPGDAVVAQERPAPLASLAGLTFAMLARTPIAHDAGMVATQGFAIPGVGAASYIADPAVDERYVAAYPRAAFLTRDGRGFRLAEDPVTPQMLGATGDGAADDHEALTAAVDHVRRHGGTVRIPAGRYRLTASLALNPVHDGFPYHPLSVLGDQMDAVTLLLDYDGTAGVRVNDATGAYSALSGARIGGFTISVAPGRRIVQPLRILNALNCTFADIRVRADWAGMTDATEMVRISAATQWCRFANIVVEPFGLPARLSAGVMRGTGISIGHPYRDVALVSSAVSNNSFHDCTVNQCRIGFLTEAADATAIYSGRVVQSRLNWVDRASYSTLYVDPWDEGAFERGFTFEAARITDPTGTNVRKTQYPQVVGGYVSSIRLDGVVGASIRAAVNALEITAAVQRCHAVLLGQDNATVAGEEHDCLVERFDTARNVHLVTRGGFAQVRRSGRTGAEVHLDDAGDPGIGIYRPAGAGRFSGFREEAGAGGEQRSYIWGDAAIGTETRTLVRRVTADRHEFATGLYPDADNRWDLGAGNRRWRALFLGRSPVVTSDARVKRDISDLPEPWLDAWQAVRWCHFRYASEEESEGDPRWHAGLVAQQVIAAFAAQGVDAAATGLLERSPGAGPSAGEDVVWGVRYDQCQALEAAWQRREMARLARRLAAIEAAMGGPIDAG